MFAMNISFEKLEMKPRKPGKLGWKYHLQGPGSFPYLVLRWQLEWTCRYFLNIKNHIYKYKYEWQTPSAFLLSHWICDTSGQGWLGLTQASVLISFTSLKVVLSANRMLFLLIVLGQYKINWKKKIINTHTETHTRNRDRCPQGAKWIIPEIV